MLGFNGGLMGVRRTPTAAAASGLWFQNEQSVARRAAIWPDSPTNINLSSINYLYHAPHIDYRMPPPSVANMQDGVIVNPSGTFVDSFSGGGPFGNIAFVTMDLGATRVVGTIVYGQTPVGTDWASSPGPNGFHDNADIHYSSDNTTWTFLLNVGSYGGIQQRTVAISARYIRISASVYLGLSEFYALAPGQVYP